MIDTNVFYMLGLVVFLVGCFALAKLLLSLRRVVPTNMVHIVQSKSVTKTYGKGKDFGNVYYKWPEWIPYLGVMVTEFPESIFQVSLTGYDAYDQKKLPFIVDIVAFFRIKDAGVAAQRVASFQELRTQLENIVQGSVRRILGGSELDSIMTERSVFGDQFTEEVRLQVEEWGVLPVKMIEFMDIRDKQGSSVIEDMMAKEKSRINMESRTQIAENNKQATVKEVEASQVIESAKIEAKQQVSLKNAEVQLNVGLADERAKQENHIARAVTIEKEMLASKVSQVSSAEIEREVASVQAQQKKEVEVITADARASVLKIDTAAHAEAKVKEAEGLLQAARMESEGVIAIGDAKAKAEEAMLMAPVNAQIALSKEIGSNQGYQEYLITTNKIEAAKEVGIESAKAMQNAELKVIANTGSPDAGLSSIADAFTAKGGAGMMGMLENLGQSEFGKDIIGRLSGQAK